VADYLAVCNRTLTFAVTTDKRSSESICYVILLTKVFSERLWPVRSDNQTVISYCDQWSYCPYREWMAANETLGISNRTLSTQTKRSHQAHRRVYVKIELVGVLSITHSSCGIPRPSHTQFLWHTTSITHTVFVAYHMHHTQFLWGYCPSHYFFLDPQRKALCLGGCCKLPRKKLKLCICPSVTTADRAEVAALGQGLHGICILK
jgi:hypothetical protein